MLHRIKIESIKVYKFGTRVKFDNYPYRIWDTIPGAIIAKDAKARESRKHLMFYGFHDPEEVIANIKSARELHRATEFDTSDYFLEITEYCKDRSYNLKYIKLETTRAKKKRATITTQVTYHRPVEAVQAQQEPIQ